MLETRVLSPDDWPLWRELRLAALTEAPYAFGSTLAEWQGDGDREERWRNRLAIPGIHLVVLLNGIPAGMVSGIPSERPEAVEVISVWVAPQARGHGVGDRLMHEVGLWARGLAATTVQLSVMPDNQRAIALYLRHGFMDSGKLGARLPDGRHERVLAHRLGAE